MDSTNIAKISKDSELPILVILELLEKVEKLNNLDEQQLFTWLISHYEGKYISYEDIGLYLMSERAKQPFPDWLESYIDFELYVLDQEEEKHIVVTGCLSMSPLYLFRLDKE